MNDLQSLMGYAFNSPFRNNPYLDINTPEGLIDMSNTPIDLLGIDNLGNRKKLKAGRKNPYKFEGTQVREIPMQVGGVKSYNPNLAAKDKAFQEWYLSNTLEGKNKVPYSEKLDYDYYSLFRNGATGSVKDHFPDTYKRPTHPTFSDESIYSVPGNTGGHWQGDRFIPKRQEGGNVYQQFYNRYMNSDVYKQRLQNTGYELPASTIAHRSYAVNSSKIEKDYELGSTSTVPNVVRINPDQGPIPMIASHEYAHKAGAMREGYNKNNFLNMNSREMDEFNNRNISSKEGHLGQPDEAKADMDSLRFLMESNGLGTPMEEMTPERLQKAKDHKDIKGNLIMDRLQKRYSDGDLLWLMNNIAGNQQSNSNTAQTGGRTPIYTTDLKDPRLQAYNDSLKLYNANAKNFDSSLNSLPAYSEIKNLSKWPGKIKPVRGAELDYNKVAQMPSFTYLQDPADASKATSLQSYKRPVQPVVYNQPYEDLQDMYGISQVDMKTPDLSGLPVNPYIKAPAFQQANPDYISSKPTKYSFTNYDDSKTYFKDKNGLQQFIKSTRNTSTQEGEDYMTATGYLKRGGRNPYQMGGKAFFDFLFDDEDETPVKKQESLPTAPSTDEVDVENYDMRRQQENYDNDALAMSILSENRAQRGNPYSSGRGSFEPQNGNPYTGEILSSGQFGNQNVGSYGKEIYSQLANDLGYAPKANSIFRSKTQQDALIASGAPAVSNSWHLSGNAVDIKPTDWHKLSNEQQQYYRMTYDVVYHNNHYHIEPK